MSFFFPCVPKKSLEGKMKRTRLCSVTAILFALLFLVTQGKKKDIGQEIRDHRQDAQRIIELVTRGAAKGQTHKRLATMADTFGHRLSGSDRLEQAIDWVLQQMRAEGLENVHGETAMVPYWVRGKEYVELLEPQGKNLAMLGLGNSIGTPPEGITAEAIVVSSFSDLQRKAAENRTMGRIVVFNQFCDWVKKPIACYGQSVAYRTNGAIKAARVGAVASLTRSVAPFSIDSPHTGAMSYNDNVKKIPAACITIEDAEMLARMQERGDRIVLKVYMEARSMPSRPSRNVIAEIVGSTYPDEVVVVSGHIDSWDVGQGAMDDAGGAFISWQALSLLKLLNLRPKRTLRAIMWTCEEFGGIGAQQYFNDHQANISKFDLVMESDMGTFLPWGIQFTGSNSSLNIMKSIGGLLAPINATLVTTGGEGTDIDPFIQAGVPGASLANDNAKYFWFHHSQGDMMTVLNSTELDLCAATWAVTSYVVADLDEMLPR